MPGWQKPVQHFGPAAESSVEHVWPNSMHVRLLIVLASVPAAPSTTRRKGAKSFMSGFWLGRRKRRAW